MLGNRKAWLCLTVLLLLSSSFNISLSVSENYSSLRRSRGFAARQFVQSMPASDQFYFMGLLSQYESSSDSGEEVVLRIGDTFVPSAMLTQEQRVSLMGVVDYAVLQSRYGDSSCGDIVLWLAPMDGGIGSSLQRLDYLKQISGREELGAKSIDIFFPIEINDQTIMVSVAEIKLLNAIRWVKEDRIGEVGYFELVSTESEESISALMDSTYLLDRVDDSIAQDSKRTYRDIFNELGMDLEVAVQQLFPTVDTTTGVLSMERRAPGGHGHWGLWILQNILNWEGQDQAVAAIYNNDGLNNSPDQAMIGWMVEENIPIAMISTTRTSLDTKGGIIGIVTLPDGRTYTDLLEIKQADKVEQGEQFQAMGLTEGELGAQYFNTNMFLFNVGLLSPFLKELKGVLGDDEFNRVVFPTLIQNTKSQDGKEFIQLEGAIGSVVLNFGKYLATTDNQEVRALMEKHGITRLVSILNVEEEARTDFFTPVKAAVDVWFLQPERGVFSVDSESHGLIKEDPSRPLPQISLSDSGYEDLSVLMDHFSSVDLSEASSFIVQGRVRMPAADIRGRVEIISAFEGVFDLSSEEAISQISSLIAADNRLILDNISLNIDSNGRISF
ncbi:MAG: UTP--glucose-1-phosphate uridylyltransferase [Candidatus Kaelpia aquatica]|nr:UTP--glucose-1-phosphate uridylyltransferase [Candidatus Kaelpia aquatica]